MRSKLPVTRQELVLHDSKTIVPTIDLNEAVPHIDHMPQQNAALVEQAADARALRKPASSLRLAA